MLCWNLCAWQAWRLRVYSCQCVHKMTQIWRTREYVSSDYQRGCLNMRSFVVFKDSWLQSSLRSPQNTFDNFNWKYHTLQIYLQSVISRCPWQRILHIPWIHMTLSPWEYVWEFPPQILTSTTNSHRVSTQIQIEFAAEKQLSRNRALLFEYKVTDTTISQHIDTVRTSITLPLFMIRFVCVCACVCACVCVRVCACVYVYVSLALALALSLSSSLSLSHFLSLVLSLSLSFSLSFSLSISLFLWVQSTTKEYETSGSRVRISSTCPLAPSHAATHMHTNYMQEWTDKYAHRPDK